MKMKIQTFKLMISILGITILAGTHIELFAADKKPKVTAPKASPVARPSNKSCVDEKTEFKRLYIQLQNSLNYEGKDAYLENGKGPVLLKPHTGSTYEGKVFEEALFKEYQNSLRKVALMYQSAKFDKSASAEFKSNKSLVDFIKAVDDGTDGTAKYIAENNVNKVIDELQKTSVAKYPAGSKSILTDNDKYMLQKLLTHSQDRLCSIEKYQETGKRDRNFSKEELEKKKNAPLNQLILSIKDAKLTKDSDIKLEDIVDDKAAINSAIASNIKALNDWARKNKNCIAAVKDSGFMNSIQAGIQSCNYRKFVDTLDNNNVTNIEQVLHFINSNEKFLKGVQTKAETSLDELKLQAYVDRTFENLGNKINCSEVVNSTNSNKRLFVRNLPYIDSENKFDTSKISCKIKSVATKTNPASEKVLSEKECSAKILLISDEMGRGIEVKQKNPKEAAITFSIKDNPECSDIALVVEEVKPVVEPEIVVDVKPPVVTATGMTATMCALEAEKIKFPGVGTLGPDGKCKNVTSDEKCNEQKKGQISNPEKTECIDPPGIPAVKPEVKPEPTLTEKLCADKGKGFDPVNIVCVDKKEEKPEEAEQKSCDAKNAQLTKDNEGRPKVGWEMKDGKCVEVKEDPEVLKCAENNKKLSEENNGRPGTDWIIKDGKCINKKFKPSKSKDTEFDDEDVRIAPDNSKFPIPARFTPIQIPTRQMYILPGMP